MFNDGQIQRAVPPSHTKECVLRHSARIGELVYVCLILTGILSARSPQGLNVLNLDGRDLNVIGRCRSDAAYRRLRLGSAHRGEHARSAGSY